MCFLRGKGKEKKNLHIIAAGNNNSEGVTRVLLTVLTNSFSLKLDQTTEKQRFYFPEDIIAYRLWNRQRFLERSSDDMCIRKAAMHIVALPITVSAAWRATNTYTSETDYSYFPYSISIREKEKRTASCITIRWMHVNNHALY